MMHHYNVISVKMLLKVVKYHKNNESNENQQVVLP